MGGYKVYCCFTRKYKVTKADPPPDVIEAFNKYSEGGTHMTVDQLRKFIEECQGDNGGLTSAMEVEKIMLQILPKRHRKSFTLEDFHRYLFSSKLNPPIVSQVHHDMSAPLSHYFIYTGHNSYLTGDQLSSSCSEVPIIKALIRGVRVIELDVWPNPSRDNVHVLHGRTLTTPVDLLRCLRSIKEYAFVSSPYLVIIALEDHLTPDLQAKVARMICETFGDMLYYPESGKQNDLPSPDQLKYRVLISTKPSTEYLEAEEDKLNELLTPDKLRYRVYFSTKPLMEYLDAKEDKPTTSRRIKDPNNDDKDASDESDSDIEELGYHTIGKPKGGLEEALKVKTDEVRRLSLAVQALERAAEHLQQDIVRFTQKNILRIYPKVTRFTSSNYKPLDGWLHGAQMVALNMQAYCRSLWLMHGMFRANGGCGYVKKPDFLMTNGPNNEVFDFKAKLPVKQTLKVKIYMGDGWHLDFNKTHFDTYSPPDFYTRVGICGAPADEIMRKTKPKEDNWTPVWDEEFTFPLTLPELALLRIEVHEYDMSEKDDFAGQTFLPVSELRRGIRAVPLYNREGDPYTSARLLVRFEFE